MEPFRETLFIGQSRKRGLPAWWKKSLEPSFRAERGIWSCTRRRKTEQIPQSGKERRTSEWHRPAFFIRLL